MVAFTPLALAAALATTASAHFGLEYPVWRSATLGTGHNYSQWTYPCAGVPADLPNGNRTDWPLKGGSIKLDLHHDWTYVFINLGLGANVSNFNYTLTPEFWNATGSGTLCVPELLLPTGLNVTDGTQGSIQVVTVGESGAGLYNVSFLSHALACCVDRLLTVLVPVRRHHLPRQRQSPCGRRLQDHRWPGIRPRQGRRRFFRQRDHG